MILIQTYKHDIFKRNLLNYVIRNNKNTHYCDYHFVLCIVWKWGNTFHLNHFIDKFWEQLRHSLSLVVVFWSIKSPNTISGKKPKIYVVLYSIQTLWYYCFVSIHIQSSIQKSKNVSYHCSQEDKPQLLPLKYSCVIFSKCKITSICIK